VSRWPLVHDGRVAWAQGYGVAEKSADIPVTENTVFQAASISKSVTAWGVMRLVEQGKVDLDAPVSTYLSRWKLPPSRFDPDRVTVRRLLSHTAGLSVGGYLGYEPTTPLPPLETELTVGADAAEADGAVRIVFPPGDQVHYSGGGYAVLQLLVEEVSDQSFAEFMQREVLDRLGMTQSSFELARGLKQDVAKPHGVDGTILPLYRFAAKAAGGLYTTAPDLARFVAAAMAGPSGTPRGRGVLGSATVDEMVSPAPNATLKLGPLQVSAYGLGYSIHPVLLGRGGRIVGHDGSNQGWKTAFLALPAEGEGIVILTNSETGKALEERVKCRWAAWAGGGTIPVCLNMHLLQDALIGGGIWLALVLALVFGGRLLGRGRRVEFARVEFASE
jgi:CubicO group peptidase (beta-lactamase class C family)